MTEHEGGTEWELREAENAMVAAGDDPTARALAMRRHAEAQRNMMQSVLVPSFLHAAETLIDTSAAKVIASVQINIDVLTALVQQVLTATRRGAARLGKLEKDMRALDRRHADQIAALAADIAAIKKDMVIHPDDQQRLEARLAALEVDVAALKRDGDSRG